MTWKFLKAHGRWTYKRSKDRDPFCVLVRSQRAAIFVLLLLLLLQEFYFRWHLICTQMFLLKFCVTSIRASKKSKVTAHSKRSSSIFLPLKCKKRNCWKEILSKVSYHCHNPFVFLFVQKKFGRCLSIKSWFQRFFLLTVHILMRKKAYPFFCVTSFSLFIEMTFAHSRCWAYVIHSSFLFPSLHSKLNETERVGIDILWKIKNHSGVVSIVYSHDGTTKQPVVTI